MKIYFCQTANNTSTIARHNVLCLLANDHLYQARLLTTTSQVQIGLADQALLDQMSVLSQ